MRLEKALLIWVILLAACSMVFAEEQTAEEAKKIPDVVARVNGEEIKAEQYRNLWRLIHRQRARENHLAAIGPDYVQAVKKEVIQRLITLELLRQQADELGYEVDPKVVDMKLQELKNRMDRPMGVPGLAEIPEPNWDAYRVDIESSMKIEKLLKQEIYDQISVTPQEVRDYYDGHPNEFRAEEEVKARHILVMTLDDEDEAKVEEALKAIREAAARIESGEPFEEVAREVSQDGSAHNGGDLGYFSRGRMVPEFDEVAFSLEEGEVSDIVKTRFGYHLIQVEDRRPERMLPFEDVKVGIKEHLKQQKANTLGEAYIDELKAEAEIETLY